MKIAVLCSASGRLEASPEQPSAGGRVARAGWRQGGPALRLFLAVLSLAPAAAQAATYRVPGDFPDLEAAINSASSGDQIILAAGVYQGKGWVELDFRGKALHIRSESGPDHCVIDCAGGTRAFTFRNAEPPEAVLEGLTIRNGRMPYQGGALYLTGGAQPTIRACHFIQNLVYDPFCLGGCTTTGGAVALAGAGDVLFEGCLFLSNSAQLGGAVSLTSGAALFRRCRFIANTAEPSIERSAGGAVYAADAELRFESCEWIANFADTVGARAEGGALALENVVCSIQNGTFSANFSTVEGDILAAADVSVVTVENSILWNIPQAPFAFDDSSTVLCRFSNIAQGWPGEGNIDRDPLFRNPRGVDGLLGTPDDDLGLRDGSPCVDAGDPAYQPSGAVRDLAGRLRLWDGDGVAGRRVDMGAHEHRAPGTGDVNCDRLVDFNDLSAFVLALTSPAAYAAAFPDCEHLLADANLDGGVDFDDIDAFVRLLTGG